MIIHDLAQGSDAWHQFRLEHFGASEAAAMLGLSKKVKRDELLYMKKTGTAKEFSEWVQKNILDHGHEVEALARPIIEEEFGIDLYPVTCSEGKPSASCDGLTLDEETAFEHKQWNKELAENVLNGVLPDDHWPQCQQILLITGARRVIFVVSDGTPGNMVKMEVFPDYDKFNQILDGWAQFQKDFDAYVPVIHPEKPEAQAVMGLPALSIETIGSIAVIHNLESFGKELNEFIQKIDLEPTDDQGFANAEYAAKILRQAEQALEAAEASSMAQTPGVDEMRRLVAFQKETARKMAIALEKMVKFRKQQIKDEALTKVVALYNAYVEALQEELKPGNMYCPSPDFWGAAKNKRTLASLHDALNTTLANGKIAADAAAKEIRVKLAWYKDAAKGYEILFSDLQFAILKPADDFQLLVTSRIEQHKFTERKKIEEGARALILAEEQKKAEAAAEAEAEFKAQMTAALAPQVPKQPEPAKPAQIVVKTAPSGTSKALMLRARHELSEILRLYKDIEELAGIMCEINRFMESNRSPLQIIEETAHYQAETA
jgi:predicted phage-related endonuclease